MARIVAVVNAKGGVGKTTSAVSLAQWLGRGRPVLLVDTDPQASATVWVEENDGGGFTFDVAHETDPGVLDRLRDVEGYEVVVVDTQPALASEGLRAVLGRADYAVLPVLAERMDQVVLVDTLREVVVPLGIAFRVLITRQDPRSMGEARAYLQEYAAGGIPAFATVVREYKAHRRARRQGVPVGAYRGLKAHQAAKDYRLVGEELLRDLAELDEAGRAGRSGGNPRPGNPGPGNPSRVHGHGEEAV